MRRMVSITALIFGLSSLPFALQAQEETDGQTEGDETMEMIEESETEGEALSLPEDAAEEGVENSEQGLTTANEAREGGREFGQSRADAKRPEDAGRPDEAGRPDDAGRPDEAGRPDDAGRPE